MLKNPCKTEILPGIFSSFVDQTGGKSMRTILLMVVALLGSLISLGAMQEQRPPSDQKFDTQLTEASTSENIRIFRSLLIDVLDKRDTVRVKKILTCITYDEAYSLIITWVPDTDIPMADKIQAWLDFLHTFAPSINDEDEDIGELNSPVIYEPHPDSQGIFAPFTPSEKQDGL
jgi:hypothetical protein